MKKSFAVSPMPLISRAVLTCVCLWGLLQASAQEEVLILDTTYTHSPRRATILSAVLPGAGQIYNKKYWKLPLVYGGMGTAIYFIDRNTKDIRYFKDQVIAIQDDDPLTVNETFLTEGQLIETIDQRKNWRDWSYVATLLVYGLQILDANVDAHLYYFDVDDDISMSILPYMEPTVAPSAGVQLALHF